MAKGFSGAAVEVLEDRVIKRHPNADSQGLLCSTGALRFVSPQIFEVDAIDSSYVMERLAELSIDQILDAPATLCHARQLLARKVWTHTSAQSSAWKLFLADRFRGIMGLDIDDLIHNLWIDNGMWQCTHGDPTLSNMMMRGDDMVLIDPIRTRHVPAHWTVDMGKLLQSAIGWERVLCDWRYNRKQCVQNLLFGLEPISIKRSWFWCMVHCARIVPYAEKAKNEKARAWAMDKANALFHVLRANDFNEGTVCSMLLI